MGMATVIGAFVIPVVALFASVTVAIQPSTFTNSATSQNSQILTADQREKIRQEGMQQLFQMQQNIRNDLRIIEDLNLHMEPQDERRWIDAVEALRMDSQRYNDINRKYRLGKPSLDQRGWPVQLLVWAD